MRSPIRWHQPGGRGDSVRVPLPKKQPESNPKKASGKPTKQLEQLKLPKNSMFELNQLRTRQKKLTKLGSVAR